MTLARAVARERTRLATVLGAAGAASGLALALAALAAGAFVLRRGAWIAHPAAPLAAWALAIALLVLAAALTARALRRRAGPSALARAIEGERGLRSGALRAATEAESDGALGAHAAQIMHERIAPLGTVLAPAALRSGWRALALAAVAFAAAAIFAARAARAASDGWRAVRHPARALAGTLLPPLRILDAPAGVMRGDSVAVRIAAVGRATLTLRSRTTGAPWREVSLPVQDGEAAARLGPVDADLTLVASDGRALSDTAVVRVRDRAFVSDVTVIASYPAYLARAAEPLPAGEPMRLPQGTVLRIDARASTELTVAGLARDGSADTVHFRVDGRRASGRLGGSAAGAWHWFAAGAAGPIADVPAPLDIAISPDAPPRAEIILPAGDTVLAASGQLALSLAASDDHGITHVWLRSWRDSTARSAATQLLVSGGPFQAWSTIFALDLAPRGLAPGDALHVALEAEDDSPWHQRGRSRELVIRIPTAAEARAIARALGDSAVARTAAAASAERDLEQRTSEAARERGDRGDAEHTGQRAMDYGSAERAAALAKQQQQLVQQVQVAQKSAEDLERALRQAGALDTTLARQLADARQLLADAITPEMARQLAAVMNAQSRLSPEETRRSLEQLARQQERLREELERSAAMLKRAALEGAMQTLRDDARELAAQGKQVAESLAARAPAAPEHAGEIGERSRALSQQIDSLSARLAREQAEAAAQRMPAAAAHAQKGGEAMTQASRDSAAAAGRTGAQELAQAADALSAARDAQIRAWKEGLTDELDKASAEAMELSQTEEELAREAVSGGDSALRGDQSAVQQGVERLSSRLEHAAGQSAHVSPGSQRALAEAKARVAEATRDIAESRRGGRDAAPDLSQASDALAQAAAEMMRDRARVAGAQSASGFAEMMQKLAELAKQQGGLNQQSAGLLPSPGSAPGAMAGEQARALARQQRALANAVDEIGGGEARAAQMAREMRDIAAQLDRGKIDPALLQRQQQLFHRMLDAGLAMEKEEREDQGKRESRSADQSQAFAPVNTSAEGRTALPYGAPDWSQLRGLTADERQAVLDYFSRLNHASPP